jgi:hypothetical protein
MSKRHHSAIAIDVAQQATVEVLRQLSRITSVPHISQELEVYVLPALRELLTATENNESLQANFLPGLGAGSDVPDYQRLNELRGFASTLMRTFADAVDAGGIASERQLGTFLNKNRHRSVTDRDFSLLPQVILGTPLSAATSQVWRHGNPPRMDFATQPINSAGPEGTASVATPRTTNARRTSKAAETWVAELLSNVLDRAPLEPTTFVVYLGGQTFDLTHTEVERLRFKENDFELFFDDDRSSIARNGYPVRLHKNQTPYMVLKALLMSQGRNRFPGELGKEIEHAGDDMSQYLRHLKNVSKKRLSTIVVNSPATGWTISRSTRAVLITRSAQS